MNFNLTEWAIRHRSLVIYFMLVVVVAVTSFGGCDLDPRPDGRRAHVTAATAPTVKGVKTSPERASARATATASATTTAPRGSVSSADATPSTRAGDSTFTRRNGPRRPITSSTAVTCSPSRPTRRSHRTQ